MASLLKQEIDKIQKSRVEVCGPAVIKHHLEQFRCIGPEIGGNIETFSSYVVAENGSSKEEIELWEMLCILSDAGSPKWLEEVVGIKIDFKSATEATVTWSGK